MPVIRVEELCFLFCPSEEYKLALIHFNEL